MSASQPFDLCCHASFSVRFLTLLLSRVCFKLFHSSLVVCRHASVSGRLTILWLLTVTRVLQSTLKLWLFTVIQVFLNVSYFFGSLLSRGCVRAIHNTVVVHFCTSVSECFNILLKSTFRPETLKRDKYVVITQDNNLITSLWTV